MGIKKVITASVHKTDYEYLLNEGFCVSRLICDYLEVLAKLEKQRKQIKRNKEMAIKEKEMEKNERKKT